jgi:uncharacterized membrane protein YphA (DoxX/SURF4 family)
MAMTKRVVVYWATTGFVVFNMLSGGLAELTQVNSTAEGMQALGYPLCMMTILGIWKVLGSIALLAPRFPRLKEWAYAGMFFNMTGAAVSHLVVGDGAWHVWYTAGLAIVVLVSWALRPESPTLRAPVLDRSLRSVRRMHLAGAELAG